MRALPLRLLAGVLLLALLPACRGRPEPALEPLIGRWTTLDPLYAERSFEITAGRELELGTGEGRAERCPIVAVEGEGGEGGEWGDGGAGGAGGGGRSLSLMNPHPTCCASRPPPQAGEV